MALWLWVVSALVLAVGGQAPTSPCPEVFTYQQENGAHYGYISVPNVASRVELTVSISSSDALQRDVLQGVSGTRDFWISFRNQRLFPLINWIDLNGRRVCTNRRGVPSDYTYTSTSTRSSYSSGNSGSRSSLYSPVDNDIGTDDFYHRINAAGDSPLEAHKKWLSRITPGFFRGSPFNTPRPDIRLGDVEPFGAFSPGRPQHPSRIEPGTRTPPAAPWPSKRPTAQRPPKPAKRCGVAEVRSEIPLVHFGLPTAKGEWPWLAAIYLKKSSSHIPICGGSLVDHTHVITAAHCVVKLKTGANREPGEMYVEMGKYNLRTIDENGTQSKEIRRILVHDAYDHSTLKGDIALIELMSPVNYTMFVLPICLWNRDLSVDKIRKSSAFVVGWGHDEQGNMQTSMPMKAKAPIVSLEECRESLPGTPLNEMSLCAGSKNGSGPCTGDSGGGLMIANPDQDDDGQYVIRYYLTGVVSLGQKVDKSRDPKAKCDLYKYVVYANVNKYLGWLRQYIEQ